MFNMFAVLLPLSLLVLEIVSNPHERILGGFRVMTSVPYIVSIQENQEEGVSHICGGSIIKPNYIITAAHCVYDYTNNTSGLKIMAGTTELETISGSVQYVDVKRFILHPDYRPQEESTELHANDIALVELSANLKFNQQVGSIDTIKSDDLDQSIDNQDNAYIYGWGSTENSIISRFLYELRVTIWTQEECAADINKTDCHEFMPEIELCTAPATGISSNFKGASFRDDGGPLVVRNKLAGVILHGQHDVSEGQCHESTIYEKITQFQDFIDSNTS